MVFCCRILEDEVVRCSGYYKKKDVENLKKAFANMKITKPESFYAKLHVKIKDQETYFSDDEEYDFKLNELSM